MSEARLRELERRWKESQAPEDEAAWLASCLRAGRIHRDRLELGAYLGHAPARTVLGLEPGAEWRLPKELFLDGVELRPPSREGAEWIRARTRGSDLVIVASLPGRWELDQRTSRPLDDLLGDLISLGSRYVVLEVGGLIHIISTAIGILVKYGDILQQHDGALILVDAPPPLVRILELLNVTEWIEFDPDWEAVAARLEKADLGAPPDDHAWLRGLSRWGHELAARGALALARQESSGEHVRSVLETWASCPCLKHTRAVQVALGAYTDERTWTWAAARIVTYPKGGLGGLRLEHRTPVARDQVRQALLPEVYRAEPLPRGW